MSKFNFTQRYISTSTIDDTDGVILDVVGSDVPKRVDFSDFLSGVGGTTEITNIFNQIIESQDAKTVTLLNEIVEQQELTIKYLRKIASYE